MQEFMRLKYLSVTKILSPNLKSASLSLSYLNSFYRLWPKRPSAETTHLKNGQNDPGRNDPDSSIVGLPMNSVVWITDCLDMASAI